MTDIKNAEKKLEDLLRPSLDMLRETVENPNGMNIRERLMMASHCMVQIREANQAIDSDPDLLSIMQDPDAGGRIRSM